MSHKHVHAKMLDAETGRFSAIMVATLLGGVLLLAALAARGVYDHPFYSDTLALIAAILLGGPLVVEAIRHLAHGHTHMDELVALAVMAAFASGEYVTAGAVSFFMIISNLIESRTAEGARRTIESLIRLTPTKAIRVENGAEREVEAKDLQPGDVVRVRPGDNIPGDGQVIGGFSSVNQANITGESVPVDKTIGDDVFGGTSNQSGVLDIRITKSGQDTTLGRVQNLVLQAERTKSPAMRLASAFAGWYTPVVLMVALITLVFTRDLNAVIALLLISCPCSLILATPTAMVAALSSAARLGVLVKNVADLEQAKRLTAVLFDKTGTLTTGQLSVTRLGPAPDLADPAELLQVAASIEQNSRHPVARAVRDMAARARIDLLPVDGFEEVAGKGVRGTLNGADVFVGRDTWLRDLGIDLATPGHEAPEGFSLLYVARGGKLLGWIGLEDKTRPDAAAAMDDLRDNLGVRQVVMVTGDRWSVARRVASEMHCTDVQAEVLPAQKLQVVDGLKRKGHTVAVVGDGVNDAPALAAGDLSIAMGAAGSDVAINSASVALMNNNLNRIPFLIRLSRQTSNIITQGIAFSILYILIFSPLSIRGDIHPILAAILHAASSIVVVFNSARLVRQGEDLDTLPSGHEIGAPPTVTPEAVPRTATA